MQNKNSKIEGKICPRFFRVLRTLYIQKSKKHVRNAKAKISYNRGEYLGNGTFCDIKQKQGGWIMRRSISRILLVCGLVCIIGCLCGCGNEGEGTATDITSEENMVQIKQEESGEQTLDALAIEQWSKKDNSKDVYSAYLHTRIRTTGLEAGLYWSCSYQYALSESQVYLVKENVAGPENHWQEIVYCSQEEELSYERREVSNRISAAGTVVGKDTYLTLENKYNEAMDTRQYVVKEWDVQNQLVQSIPIDLSGMNIHTYLLMDELGQIHVGRVNPEDDRYLVFSPTGELLLEYIFEGYRFQQLFPMLDGRVACLVEEGKEKCLLYIDTETGEETVVNTFKDKLAKDYAQIIYWVEDTLLYADNTGVYQCNLQGEEPKVLYSWKNHGVVSSSVCALKRLSEDRIAILYEWNEEYYYLCLKPTTEQVEIVEIEMAIPSTMGDLYDKAIIEFNRKYPACHIEKRVVRDSTLLQTELMAGKGPVLIDTLLTGFEEQEKLWEPLGDVMEQLGVLEEVYPQVMELGRIHNTLYGVPSTFWIETVVVGDKELQDWDYAKFLQCIEEKTVWKGIIQNMNGLTGPMRFFNDFLIHSLEDNFLLDIESGTTNFNTEQFLSMLHAVMKYTHTEMEILPGTSIYNGEVLCNSLEIERPGQLAIYRLVYGEDANYIGFPGKEGANHYVTSISTLAVRKNASQMEKEIACAFLMELLSYDTQRDMMEDINFKLSMRKDVLEEQINNVQAKVPYFALGYGNIILEESEIDREKDKETLEKLLSNAKPKKNLPPELRKIFVEEMWDYMDGTITEEMFLEHLENRIGLWLSERH